MPDRTGDRPDCRDWLRRHLDVSRETLSALARYVELLMIWQATHNLVSPSTMEAVWERHIRDSAQLVPFGTTATPWLDVGSGAGFPGLVIALCRLKYRHRAPPVTLVEKNAKKVAFLQTVIRETNAPARVIRADMAHVMQTETGKPGILTARAVASLKDLCKLGYPLLAHGWRGVFPRGKTAREEIARTQQEFRFDCRVVPSVTHSDGHIVVIENIAAKSSDTPALP